MAPEGHPGSSLWPQRVTQCPHCDPRGHPRSSLWPQRVTRGPHCGPRGSPSAHIVTPGVTQGLTVAPGVTQGPHSDPGAPTLDGISFRGSFTLLLPGVPPPNTSASHCPPPLSPHVPTPCLHTAHLVVPSLSQVRLRLSCHGGPLLAGLCAFGRPASGPIPRWVGLVPIAHFTGEKTDAESGLEPGTDGILQEAARPPPPGSTRLLGTTLAAQPGARG